MVKANTKFKKGDKVKILPSAVDVHVAKSEVGKIAVITCIYDQDGIVINTPTKRYATWVVGAEHIEPAMKIGQQLLLWEDI